MTLRSSIERPEALDTGSIIATDLRFESVFAGIRAATTDHGVTDVPQDYLSSSCSVRVRNSLLSTAFEHATWAGLR